MPSFWRVVLCVNWNGSLIRRARRRQHNAIAPARTVPSSWRYRSTSWAGFCLVAPFRAVYGHGVKTRADCGRRDHGDIC